MGRKQDNQKGRKQDRLFHRMYLCTENNSIDFKTQLNAVYFQNRGEIRRGFTDGEWPVVNHQWSMKASPA